MLDGDDVCFYFLTGSFLDGGGFVLFDIPALDGYLLEFVLPRYHCTNRVEIAVLYSTLARVISC